jgi:hypothetical protein
LKIYIRTVAAGRSGYEIAKEVPENKIWVSRIDL